MAKDIGDYRLANIWRDQGVFDRTEIPCSNLDLFYIFLRSGDIRARERKDRRVWNVVWANAADSMDRQMYQWRIHPFRAWNKRSNITVCHKRILSHFDHIIRREDDSLEKLIIIGNVEGKRTWDLSPTKWIDQLKKNNFSITMKIATDRNRWRQFVRF